MTKAEIVTQIRIWMRESDDSSEVTDTQIYALVDVGLRRWLVKVLNYCGMAGFKSYTEESLAIDTYGKSAEFTATPFLIVEASIDQGYGYQTMKRREGAYEEYDEWVLNGDSEHPTYRLLPTSTPGWKLEVAPAISGTAKVRFIEDPGAFTDADATIPTDMIAMAENGLACYIAGIYRENEGSGQEDVDRCYYKAEEYLKMIPKGFRG